MKGPTTKRPAFETARLKLAHVRLESSQALAAELALVTQIVADALEVDRVGIWFLEDRERAIVCQQQFQRATRQHGSGTELHARDFPTYMRALRERRAIVADHARTHPATRELAEAYLIPNRIESLLDAPIIRRGRVVGVVCHERQGTAVPWSEREVDFAGSAADMVALVLEQADRVGLEAALKIQTEQRLEQQKLDALALMARSVAHDLNNVLSVFLAAESEVRESGLREAADSMRAAVGAGRHLAGQLYELGGDGVQGRTPDPAPPANAGKVFSRMLGSLRALATNRIKVELEVRDKQPMCRLSEGSLERIVYNLVANARDAIADTGRIAIVVRAAEEHDEAPPDHLVIEVSDDGCGMDARTRSRMFEPYFTTKPAGHGLGLSTVYAAIKRAGGSIDVASEPGHGAIFRIALPRAS